MHIAIDESGSFVHTDAADSWNDVVAYVYPESTRRALQREIDTLRRRFGRHRGEVKLGDLDEQAYVQFLRRLNELEGVCFAVATDSSLNTPDAIAQHRTRQADMILENIDRMKHQSARDGIRALADNVSRLPDQLYAQMVCQIQLVDSVLRNAILYFVQRRPVTLGAFRWRIDQKNSEITAYETAYSQVLAPFMQSRSIREPMIHLVEGDYSAFERFRFPPGEEPTYLEDEYGLEMPEGRDRSLNIGMVLREDLEFVDSRSNHGVQVADLLASGLRRCLRAEFEDNEAVAALLGGLMVRPPRDEVPVILASLGDGRVVGDAQTEVLLRMRDNAHGMVA
jgi:hypothetical protein